MGKYRTPSISCSESELIEEISEGARSKDMRLGT
jgi:hypothetical protein